MRCLHEAQLHQYNSFITLTYADDNLPFGGSLVKKHFQDFIKRLRRHIDYVYTAETLKYYMCGEYGDAFDRPHYHACLFGWDFPDKQIATQRDGIPLFSSELLTRLWPYGHSSTGEVNFETAAYTARYCLKKVTGKQADDHYTRYCPTTNATHEIEPEYNAMSLKDAIGKNWFEQYANDVYPHDETICNGHPVQPPKYYDKLLDESDPELLAKLKKNRIKKAQQNRADSTPARLAVREQVQTLKAQQLLRTYEGK